LSLTLREEDRLRVFKNFTPNFIRVIKSRIRCVGHVAHIGEKRMWWGKLQERDHLEHLIVHCRKTLNGSQINKMDMD
jgi:hypothetical protein